MRQAPAGVLELREHAHASFPADRLTERQAEGILTKFGRQLDVEFPSPKNGYLWGLASRGYVGALALDDDLAIVVRSKVPIANLGGMLAAVYDLPIADHPGLVRCTTLPELYDQLANLLARYLRKLAIQGLHQEYRPTAQVLGAIRGRLEFSESVRRQPDPRPYCHFDQRTGDVRENQIPLWVLDLILRSGLCSEPTQRALRAVRRTLEGVAGLVPITSSSASIVYSRLTERYRPALTLCRLFLDGAGPLPESGTAAAIPFLFHMPSLFERFVATWLGKRCSTDGRLELSSQERHTVGSTRKIDFVMDGVLRSTKAHAVKCVLDTKYKDVDMPSADDVAQIGFYALLTGATHGVLVYPTSVPLAWQGVSGRVGLCRLGFDLSASLDEAGEQFYRGLMTHLYAFST